MFKNVLLIGFVLFLSTGSSIAQVIGQQPDPPDFPQADGKETLEWVIERTQRIDKIINGAILTHDQINLMMRLLDVYVEFDAISLVGLYCREAQTAAEMGRESSDLMRYRKENDMNSMMLRALDVKEQSFKVRFAAESCLRTYADVEVDTIVFAPNAVIIDEAEWAILDLEDGLAARDYHIFSQKVEHAIRLIEEIEHIATTLDNCEDVEQHAADAKAACLDALGAPNWVAINRTTESAKGYLQRIKEADCKRQSSKE